MTQSTLPESPEAPNQLVYIPDISAELELLEPWTFMLDFSYNSDVAEITHNNTFGNRWETGFTSSPITLPAGTRLRVRKYMMRTINAAYSRIALMLVSTSDHRFLAPQIGKRKPKLLKRWKIIVNLPDIGYAKMRVIDDPARNEDIYED